MTDPIVDSPRFHDLVPEGYEVELVAEGFGFTEGPLWDARTGTFLFSDIEKDVISRLTPAGAQPHRAPSNIANGTTYDAAGNWIICEHYPPAIRRIGPDGAEEVLATHWDSKELNSPNDVVARTADGTIYFTDPPSGRTAQWGVERPQDLDFQGVYRIDPTGELSLVADDYEVPNGLCLSPDETRLYVCDTHKGTIRVYDVAEDGSVSGDRLFAEGMFTGDIWDGIPDGLKVDETGNVWCSGPGGVWIWSADGERLGVMATPEMVTNFGWSGPQYDELILCSFQKLFRVRTKVAGYGIPRTLGPTG
jgi:gluconolactonase